MPFERFSAQLKELQPKVRMKAMEIANELIHKKAYSEQEAIDEGIKKAQEWFYNLEG